MFARGVRPRGPLFFAGFPGKLRAVISDRPAKNIPDQEPTSDPIETIVARLVPPLQPVLGSLLRAFLGSELLVESHVRMEQAGDRSGRRTLLADVFVDLQAGPPQRPGESRAQVSHMRPLTREMQVVRRWRWSFDAEGDDEGDDIENLPPAFLSKVAGTPGVPFRRGTPDGNETPGALLLTGGPGLGKSTLGQMLCQVHRAALLSATRLPPAHVRVRDSTLNAAAAFGIHPTTARFPIRIVLSAFADWLAEEKPEANEAVLRYVVARLAKRITGLDIDQTALARILGDLLRTCPSLFVFDGLDEVAETAGRPEALAAIHELMRRLEDEQAPALVMLTSRPAAVPPDLPAFMEWRIRPLSKARALRQAFHLVRVRHQHDEDRQSEVAARLVEAWDSETTRPLFQVPLHVALTVVMADAIGRLPEERWRLFDEHYRVLYQRELEKPTDAATILREHHPLIDAVHQRVGLLLQVEGERAGGSRSLLPRERLIDVINAVLEDDDVEEPERSALVMRVIDAATDRLVMLTCLEESPDRYGFELRSLQEHFAAEAMFAGKEAHVMDRLRRVAFVPAFRNVLLIAASKIDATSGLWHLRSSIADLGAPPPTQASEDPMGILRRAELALDLLEDGFPRRSKKLAERLVDAALQLLRLPPQAQLLRMTWTLFERAEDALRVRLEEIAPGSAPGSMAFWLVVVELAESGIEWAVALGDAHWPERDEARRAIVNAAVRHWDRLGSWLGRKIGASPGTFPPSFVQSLLGGIVHVEMQAGDVPDWLEMCIVHLWADRLQFHSSSLRIPLPLPGAPSLQFQIVRSTPPPAPSVSPDGAQEGAPQTSPGADDSAAADAAATSSSGRTVSDETLGIPPAWRPFVVAVVFAADPSPANLPGVLNTLATVDDMQALRWAEPWMPWVLRMCVRCARTPDQLRTMAAAVFSTPDLFGTQEDWMRAEQAWSSGITIAQLAPAEWPAPVWDGRWFPADVTEVVRDRLLGWKPSQLTELVTRTFPKERWSGSSLTARLALAALLELAYHGAPSPVELEPEELEELVHLSGMTSLAVATVLPLWQGGLESADWPAALDRIAKSLPAAPLPAGYSAPFAEYLARQWAAEPSRTGLLRWMAEMMGDGWMPPAGLSRFADDFHDPQACIDAWGVRLSDGFSEEDAPSLAQQFASAVGRADPAMFAQVGVQRGLRQRCSPEARRVFARTLFDHLPLDLQGFWWRTFALQLLERDAPIQSGLDERAVWTELDLPLPLPWRPPSSPPPRAAVSRIEGVRLRHVRGLQDLTLPLVSDDDGRTEGRWIVLLGENGVGKSTVLRAVALALLDPPLAAALVRTSLAGYVSHDGERATIEVTIPDRVLSAIVERDSTGTESFSTTEAPRPLVFAYGCRRSSALGGVARALSFGPNERVATLFDEGADLIHAETWLKNRAFAAVDNSREKVLLDEVKKALLRAMPGIQAIDVKPDGVWLYGPAIGRTSLAGLSDGYLTMMGWIIDMIARWTEMEERKKQVIEPSFMEQMEGVVLLDELDLHLHPRWQIRVIEDLRDLFPRMTFLVTTHNPLTLLGARKGEVIVLRRSERAAEGDVAEQTAVLAEQRDLRPGLTIDQVLTGAWFGLSSTLDQGTLDLLERHEKLLRAGRGEEDEDRLAIERELRLRLGRFADTSIERMAQRVAAELSPRSARDLSPQEREMLRAKILETVAAERAAAAARKVAEKR